MKIRNLFFKSTVLIALSVFLLGSTAMAAELQVQTCIKAHPENTNCYEIHVTIVSIYPDGTQYYVTSGDAWIGDFDKVDKSLYSHVHNSSSEDCSNFILDDAAFNTDAESPNCIGKYLSQPEVYAAYKEERDRLIASAEHSRPTARAANSTDVVFSVSPNPASDFLSFHIDMGTDVTGDKLLAIYDATGKQVYIQLLNDQFSSNFSITIKDFAAGTYQVILKNKGLAIGQKTIVIQ